MKVYIITRFNMFNDSEKIVKIYSEKNKVTAKEVVDRLNKSVEDIDDIEYSLKSYLVDAEDCYD